MVGGCSESHLGKVWICRQNGMFPLRLIFQPTVPIPTAVLANRPARRIRPAGLARDHRAQQHCAVRPQTHLPGAVARRAAAAVDSRECTAKLAVIVTDYGLPDLCFLRFRTDAGTMKSPAMFWLCRAQCAGRKEHGVRRLARGAKGLAPG